MPRTAILSLVAAAGVAAMTPVSPCAEVPSRAPSTLTASLDSLVSARVAVDSFSGVVALARGERIVYERAVGLANRESRVAMSTDTRLQIASTTKLLTQIAIRQLEQQGRLALTDTLGKFLPAYHNVIARRLVTVGQLLTHRSGVGSFWNATFLARHDRVRSVSDYVDLFQDDALLFTPGTGEAYSNGGYVLLGAIIEQVSGQSYHDYVRDHILRPAGMRDTGPYDSRVATPHAAVGYTTQTADAAPGDARLAGAGPRPGDQRAAGPDSQRVLLRSPSDTARATPTGGQGMRLRILGSDGRELSPDEARAAVAARAAEAAAEHRVPHPNTAFQPGISGAAGDDYSTVGDFVKLARALTTHVLLDSARTAAVLGQRYAAGGEFRANGGGPGVNAEFSIYRSGDVLVVLSNEDPPAATVIAQFVRARLTS